LISNSIAAQVAGALLMAVIVRLVPAFAGVIGSAIAYLLVTAELFWGHSTAGFVVATLAFGALWSITMSMFLPMLIRLDPSRRAALAPPGVTLLGCSTGPIAAGLFATDTDIGAALITCAVMFALAAVFTVLAFKTRITEPAS
jgi:DHA1 family inner membrane transport protein